MGNISEEISDIALGIMMCDDGMIDSHFVLQEV
jgi:hypothetical protein